MVAPSRTTMMSRARRNGRRRSPKTDTTGHVWDQDLAVLSSGRYVFSGFYRLAGPDDQHDNRGEREREQCRSGGERGRDALGEQRRDVECFNAGGGERGDEDTESQRAAELVGHVDEPRGGAGIARPALGFGEIALRAEH